MFIWTGTAESAAFKMSTSVGIAFVLYFVSAAWTTHLFLRGAHASIIKTVFAYLAGSIVTFAMMVIVQLYLEHVERVPPIEAGKAFIVIWAVVLGPAFGVWWARRRA